MDIVFGNTKVRRACAQATGKLKRRLDDLRAVENLKDARKLPGNCHVLKADRAGQFAIDAGYPLRLIFEPAIDPLPRTKDGTWELERITVIRLLAVEDYHGK